MTDAFTIEDTRSTEIEAFPEAFSGQNAVPEVAYSDAPALYGEPEAYYPTSVGGIDPFTAGVSSLAASATAMPARMVAGAANTVNVGLDTMADAFNYSMFPAIGDYLRDTADAGRDVTDYITSPYIGEAASRRIEFFDTAEDSFGVTGRRIAGSVQGAGDTAMNLWLMSQMGTPYAGGSGVLGTAQNALAGSARMTALNPNAGENIGEMIETFGKTTASYATPIASKFAPGIAAPLTDVGLNLAVDEFVWGRPEDEAERAAQMTGSAIAGATTQGYRDSAPIKKPLEKPNRERTIERMDRYMPEEAKADADRYHQALVESLSPQDLFLHIDPAKVITHQKGDLLSIGGKVNATYGGKLTQNPKLSDDFEATVYTLRPQDYPELFYSDPQVRKSALQTSQEYRETLTDDKGYQFNISDLESSKDPFVVSVLPFSPWNGQKTAVGGRSFGDTTFVVNNSSAEKLGTLRHELRHVPSHEPFYTKQSLLETGETVQKAKQGTSPMLSPEVVKYFSQPEEIEAYLADVVRIAREKGIHEPEKIKRILKEIMDEHRQYDAEKTGNSFLDDFLPFIYKSEYKIIKDHVLKYGPGWLGSTQELAYEGMS